MSSIDGGRALSWLTEHHLLGVSILGVAVCLVGLLWVTMPQAAPRVTTEKSWLVSVVESQPSVLSPLLVAYGKVESRQVANLKTSIIAPVLEVLGQEGQWVAKGDLLVLLDARELELALGIAEAEHDRQLALFESVKNELEFTEEITRHYQALSDIADAKLKRHLDLFSNRMVSDAIVDEVRRESSQQAIILAKHLFSVGDFPNRIKQQEAVVREKRAFVDKARLDLAQTKIVSPFDGRVIQTLVAVGDRVLPGVSLMRVADHDGLEVRTSVSTKVGRQLRARIHQGFVVSATALIDDELIQFSLSRLSGDVKPGQSGIDIFFTSNEEVALDIGRVVSLAITLPEEKDVVVLPVQSIYDNNRIYRVENNRLVGINIEQVGDYVDADGRYRILVRSDQINPGDILVTTQLSRAISGLLVEPIYADQLEQALAVKPVLALGQNTPMAL